MTWTAPTGIGVYIRDLTKPLRDKWPPKRLAKFFKDHAIRQVYLLAFWDEGGNNFRMFNRNIARPYVDAFTTAGIEVGVWGFPHPNQVSRYIATMSELSQNFGDKGQIKYWLHDPELPWKPRNAPKASDTMRGQGEAIKGDGSSLNLDKLTDLALELCQHDSIERRIIGVESVGITSYGMARWHPMPWMVFAQYGWSSPQLYSVSPANVDAGLKMWADNGATSFSPSIPVFGPNSQNKLHAHMHAFVDEGTPVKVNGFVVWSFNQLANLEARTLRSFSDKMGW